MVTKKVLIGIDDTTLIKQYLLSETPINRLVQRYNLIAANDCRLKAIHEDHTGLQLKDTISQLSPDHLIELLHEYIHATKITECKFDPATSCFADKVKHCTQAAIGTCTRISKMNIQHLLHPNNNNDHKWHGSNDRRNPNKRNTDSTKEIIDACTINKRAEIFYAKSIFLILIMLFGCAMIIIVILWATNLLPIDSIPSDVGATIIDVIRFIFLSTVEK
ncbi:MAG: hypothetical protein ACD_84C00020G0002 [uncultured bacterium]|nr:MAG: hypothetical protein ACD_84C00020G0002 [uncultured bacterium]